MFAFKNNQLLKDDRYLYILERGHRRISEHLFERIKKEVGKHYGFELIYFPHIFERIRPEVIDYCFPGLDIHNIGQFIAEHTEKILDSIEVPAHRNGYRYCVRYNSDIDMFEYKEINDDYSVEWVQALTSIPPYDDDIRFRMVCDDQEEIYPLAERNFSSEMSKLEDVAFKAIDELIRSGVSIPVLKSIIESFVKPSRLHITRQGKIYLTDYGKEVKMSPLPKTIFLFYLRHPEGCSLTHLVDYKEELYQIYQSISVKDDLDKMKDSIDRLTNPFDNSICEKCSAVRRAFLEVIDEDVAKRYFISGPQGEAKGIPLDRSLVDWELVI